MKSPNQLKSVLLRQWNNADLREARLLGGTQAWPVIVPIGRPSPRLLRENLDAVKQHIQAWRKVRLGKVKWRSVSFRVTAEPVEIPVAWKLLRPSQWAEAVNDATMRDEFNKLSQLVEHSDSVFHSLFVRRRSLWSDKPIEEVLQAARLAMSLKPGYADGRPLRTLAMEGIDTKFFERHESLITTLLDARFDGEASRMGLEAFLNAFHEGNRWLLVIDLDGSLLPYEKLRVRSSELFDKPLPGTRLLIVENETCQHLLPRSPSTIAVLGTGFELAWTTATWVREKRVAYWGDLDTWGLQLLAQARSSIPELTALMMTREVYEQYPDRSVPEPIPASDIPTHLSDSEKSLFEHLRQSTRGRLEQEFIPRPQVHAAIQTWIGKQMSR